MIDFVFFSYGYGDLLLHTLNAIAKIRASSVWESLIFTSLAIATGYFAIRMSVANDIATLRHWLGKVALSVVFVQALLIPTTTVLVKDEISWKVPKTVDNIPVAFSLPISIIDGWSYGMTKTLETVLQWPGKKRITSYSTNGSIFSARIAQNMANAKFTNPETAASLNSFTERCIITRGLIGYPFTLQELRSSDNTWKMVKERTKGVVTKWEKWEKGNRTLHNCTEGVKWMEKTMSPEAKGIVTGMKGFFNKDKVIHNSFLKDIAAVYGKSTVKDAENIIQHQLLISSIDDTLASFDGIDYGLIRAKMQSEAGGWVSMATASEYLPAALGVLKILIYVCFILLLPFVVLTGGWGAYAGWVKVIFCTSLWPPLFVVLNMIVDYGFDTSKIITYGALSTAQNQYDVIATVAAGLTLAIPPISFWVVHMGSGSMVQLASTLMQGASGNAAAVGTEIATGNMSLNNKSVGNESYNNIGSDKFNTSQEQYSGEYSFNHLDGSHHKVSASGHDSIASGSGINTSSGTRKFDLGSSVEAGIHNGLTKSNTSLTALEKSYNKSKNATISNVAELVSHIAQNESAHNSIDYSKLGEEGKTLREAVTQTKTLHDRDGYGWDQAAQGSLTGYADGGVKISEAVPILHGKGGVRIDGSVQASNKSNQSLDRETGVSKNYDSDKNLNNLARSSIGIAWNKDDTKGQNLSDNVRGSYDEMKSYSDQILQKTEESKVYSAALQESRNTLATDNMDAYHLVEEGVMKEYGVSRQKAHDMIENHDTRANKIWDEIVHQRIGDTVAKVRGGKEEVLNQGKNDATEFEANYKDNVDKSRVEQVQNQAAERGFTPEVIQENINKHKTAATRNYRNLRENNRTEWQNTRDSNNELYTGMGSQADKYEEDRIGQGGASQFLLGGIGSDTLNEKLKDYKKFAETNQHKPAHYKINYKNK